MSRICKCLEKNRLNFNLTFYCLVTKWRNEEEIQTYMYWFRAFKILSVYLQCICSSLSVLNCYLAHMEIHCKCLQNMRIPLAGGKKRMVLKLPGEDSLCLIHSRLRATWRWGVLTPLCHSASTSRPGIRQVPTDVCWTNGWMDVYILQKEIIGKERRGEAEEEGETLIQSGKHGRMCVQGRVESDIGIVEWEGVVAEETAQSLCSHTGKDIFLFYRDGQVIVPHFLLFSFWRPH